jgi:hypothetical protein
MAFVSVLARCTENTPALKLFDHRVFHWNYGDTLTPLYAHPHPGGASDDYPAEVGPGRVDPRIKFGDTHDEAESVALEFRRRLI